jgi:hypothetical protein
MLTDQDRELVTDAAAHEWDITVPRWNMPRDKFVAWHVSMAEKSARRVARQAKT